MSLKYVLIIVAIIVGVFCDDPPPASFLLVNPSDVTQRTVLTDDFSGIDPNLWTIVMTHGWNAAISSSWYYDMPRQFFIKGSYNIILVDWDRIANEYYTSAAPKTRVVGQYLGDFLIHLSQSIGLVFSKIHLIGHSLGAHVSGFAGQTTKLQGFIVARITALDAANPEFPTFGWHNEDHRVSTEDTAMLVALHTDGGVLGILPPYGHADFYPNCGTPIQPPCLQADLTNILNIVDFCSHSMAHEYFTEAVNSNDFIGKICTIGICPFKICRSNQRAILGPDTPVTTRGVFYFKTRATSPYAMGEAGLRLI